MAVRDERGQIVEICRRLYQRGYITATDGNVSVRIPGDGMLVTPTGAHKGELAREQIVEVDENGEPRPGQPHRPSSEFLMHMEIYRLRPDVNAVVHAHPAVTIAFSVAGLSMEAPVLSEVVLTLGKVPTVPYCTPTTDEVPRALAPYVADHQALILERHGSITYGRTLEEAYIYLERLEHAAQILFHAHQLGPVTALPPDKVSRLQALREGACGNPILSCD